MLQKGGMASQGHACNRAAAWAWTLTLFTHTPQLLTHQLGQGVACQLGDVRSVAAEGGTRSPVVLYSTLHLLWRSLCTLRLKSLEVPLLDVRAQGGCKGQRFHVAEGWGLVALHPCPYLRTTCTYSWVRSRNSVKISQTLKGEYLPYLASSVYLTLESELGKICPYPSRT